MYIINYLLMCLFPMNMSRVRILSYLSLHPHSLMYSLHHILFLNK